MVADPAQAESEPESAQEDGIADKEEGIGEKQPEEEEEEEDVLEDEADVQEHLRDAVEGNLRLKRLLSRDGATCARKKRKTSGPDARRPIEDAKVKQLVQKWGLENDAVVQHVLDGLTLQELKNLVDSQYTPDKFNSWKSAAELLQNHVAQLREMVLAGGGPLDVVKTFKFRWQLDPAQELFLRKLCHKDLRFVISEYDGTKTLEEVADEAKLVVPPEGLTSSAEPDAPGCLTLGRFQRLELIDPLADAAVFGDANLTFSLKLARHRKDLGHVGRVIATTFESLEILRERYPEIDNTIKELEDHYAEVWHEVDCTRIAVDPRFKNVENSLGAVYYNFPHAGAVGGFFDGHPLVNWRHENLMRLFFRALRSFVKPGGCVKIASNQGAVGVRYSYIIGSGIENEFVHVETMGFLDWMLHSYQRSYGDRRDAHKRPEQGQGYNAQRAETDMVYCFCYSPTGSQLPKQAIRRPPSLKVIEGCQDGPLKGAIGEGRRMQAENLFKRFTKEISGVHVG